MSTLALVRVGWENLRRHEDETRHCVPDWHMPRRLAKPCAHPGCPELTRERFCPAHTRASRRRQDEVRGTAAARGYCSARWKKLREYVLAVQPLCQWPGCRAFATEVDHVIPKSDGGADEAGNLQGLCHHHHARKTALLDGGFGRARAVRALCNEPDATDAMAPPP